MYKPYKISSKTFWYLRTYSWHIYTLLVKLNASI